MPQSYTALYVHAVFSTKNREASITGDLQPRLYEYIGGIVRSHDGRLLAAGGMPDHVHLLLSLGKQQSIADAMRVIKSNSSGWVHETFPDRLKFAWQSGYGAFTVSHSGLDAVTKYIADQEEHHKTQTFQEEFVALLDRHKISYNNRYLWD